MVRMDRGLEQSSLWLGGGVKAETRAQPLPGQHSSGSQAPDSPTHPRLPSCQLASPGAKGNSLGQEFRARGDS